MAVQVIDITILEDDGPTTLIEIVTDAGSIQVIGEIGVLDRDLVVVRTHIQGLWPGALGRQGLNEIAQRIMELADVDTLAVHGGVRSTGRNIGRPPKPFIARRRAGP